MAVKIDPSEFRQYTNLEFIAKQVVEGFITGLHKSPFHGFSVEFAEHRIYNNGESTKNIDWKLFARSDKLFSKRYEEETNLRCQIIIDGSSSMFYPYLEKDSKNKLNKVEFSALAASALTYLLKKQRDAVGLSIFSDNLYVNTPAKSTTAHHKILQLELIKLLQKNPIEINQTTEAEKALHLIAESIHKRSLVIVFSDMLEIGGNLNGLFAALQHLRHNMHEVIIFHVYDKEKEVNFNFENRLYKFIDMETKQEIKLNPIELKHRYQESIKKLHLSIKNKCAQYHVDYIEADINKGYDQILLPYLHKRSKMY